MLEKIQNEGEDGTSEMNRKEIIKDIHDLWLKEELFWG